jgi:hypothetical protein
MTAPLLRLARSAQYVGALTSPPSRHRNNGPIPVVTPKGRLPSCRRKLDLASRLSRLAHPDAGRHPRLWGRVGESELAMGCHLPQPPFNVKAATALPALAPPVSTGPELQPLHDAMPSSVGPRVGTAGAVIILLWRHVTRDFNHLDSLVTSRKMHPCCRLPHSLDMGRSRRNNRRWERSGTSLQLTESGSPQGPERS